MAFDYMHPPEDFEYLGEWCKAWRDPATGDWTISQLLDGLETEPKQPSATSSTSRNNDAQTEKEAYHERNRYG